MTDNSSQNNNVSNSGGFSTIVETVSDGLGYLFKDFPASFSDLDELKKALNVDTKRADIRTAGLVIVPFSILSIIFALKLKFWPIVFALGVNVLFYKVLKSLVTETRKTLSDADKEAGARFLKESTSEQYLHPEASIIKSDNSGLDGYIENIENNCNYELFDQLLRMVLKTHGTRSKLHQCAYDVKNTAPANGSIVTRIWNLIQ